jgi:hypothetical protein
MLIQIPPLTFWIARLNAILECCQCLMSTFQSIAEKLFLNPREYLQDWAAGSTEDSLYQINQAFLIFQVKKNNNK